MTHDNNIIKATTDRIAGQHTGPTEATLVEQMRRSMQRTRSNSVCMAVSTEIAEALDDADYSFALELAGV